MWSRWMPVFAQVDAAPAEDYLGQLDGVLEGGVPLAVAVGVSLISYIYVSACLMTVARKTNTAGAGLAWIPVANVFLATSVARMSPIWAVLALMPCFNILALPMIVAGMAAARGKSGGLAVLLFIPGLNLLLPALLAMGPATGAAATWQPAAQPMAGGGGACPQCGAAVRPGGAFCGHCGRPVAQAAMASAAGAPAAAARPGMGCGTVLLLGIFGFMFLSCCGVGGFVYWKMPRGYTAPVREPPKLPAGMAGTRVPFPRDSETTGGVRPTVSGSQVVQTKPDGTVYCPLPVPQTQLPPGITSTSLGTEVRSVSTAVYRPTDRTGVAPAGGSGGQPATFGPAITIHSLEPRSSATAQNLVQQITQANPGAEVRTEGIQTVRGETYRCWTVPTAPGGQATVMQATSQPLVVLVYAPTAETIPTANRLVENVGNSQGLNNPEEISCIEVIPSAPPDGFELVWLWSWSKAETDPALFSQGAGNDPQLAELLQKIKAILPETLTAGGYVRDSQERRVIVATYTSPFQAWALWSMVSVTLGQAASGKVNVGGVEALLFQESTGVGIAFQKGPYIVLLQSDDPQDAAALQELGNSLQL